MSDATLGESHLEDSTLVGERFFLMAHNASPEATRLLAQQTGFPWRPCPALWLDVGKHSLNVRLRPRFFPGPCNDLCIWWLPDDPAQRTAQHHWRSVDGSGPQRCHWAIAAATQWRSLSSQEHDDFGWSTIGHPCHGILDQEGGRVLWRQSFSCERPFQPNPDSPGGMQASRTPKTAGVRRANHQRRSWLFLPARLLHVRLCWSAMWPLPEAPRRKDQRPRPRPLRWDHGLHKVQDLVCTA